MDIPELQVRMENVVRQHTDLLSQEQHLAERLDQIRVERQMLAGKAQAYQEMIAEMAAAASREASQNGSGDSEQVAVVAAAAEADAASSSDE